jgi:hypothetical protein
VNIPQPNFVRVKFTLRLAVYRQLVRLGDKPLQTNEQYFFPTEPLRSKSLRNILSDERMGLSFTIVDAPRQRSHSQVRVQRDSRPHFSVSDSRLPQPGGPGPCIYIPPETGWLSYTPRHWVPFSSPSTILRWRYWTLPPYGQLNCSANCLQDNSSARTKQKTQPLYFYEDVHRAVV